MNTRPSASRPMDQLTDAQETVPFPHTVPHAATLPSERPVCTRESRCKGCPYPAHGFICWSETGPCLRTLTERRRKPQNLPARMASTKSEKENTPKMEVQENGICL